MVSGGRKVIDRAPLSLLVDLGLDRVRAKCCDSRPVGAGIKKNDIVMVAAISRKF